MSAYIKQLNAAVERDRAQRAKRERAATQAVRDRLKIDQTLRLL